MIKNKYVISIIIPFYNSWETLGRAIKSVLNQSYQLFEIILINDGSKDRNRDEYRRTFCIDSRVKLIEKENGGLSSARQMGIDLASGDFICTLDADDYYDSQFLEKMLISIIDDDADIAVCGRADLTTQGIKNYPITPIKSLNCDVAPFSDYFSHCIRYFKLGDSWNKLYRTSFIKKTTVKYHLPKGYHGNDYLFNFELLFFKPRFISIADCLIIHDITSASMTRRFNPKKIIGFYYIFDSLINLASKNGVVVSIKESLNNEFTILTVMCLKNWLEYSKRDKRKSLRIIIDTVYKAETNLHISINSKYVKTNADKLLVFSCKKSYTFVLFILLILYRINAWKKR